jgi:hypothetical protein
MKSSSHTYSTVAQSLGFTEHQPRNAVPPMYPIRFVCDGNTDERLAGLVRLLSPLFSLLQQCFAYRLNTAIRRNNYCGLARLKLRADAGPLLERKVRSNSARIKAHSGIRSTTGKKDWGIRELIRCEPVT